MIHLGDVNKGATVRLPFNSAGADGTSITLAANGTAKAYVDGGTTEITSGVTLTEDHDAIAGRHFVAVDTTGSGFTVGSDILVAVDGMTIDGVTVNVWVGSFSINRRRGGVSLVGLAQTGASGTVTLPASAVATDDYYNGQLAKIVYGTGAGQSRWITDYVGSSKIAAIDPNWATVPDSTSVLELEQAAPPTTTTLPDVNTKTITAGAITAASIAADAFTAAKFASDVTTELQSGLATAAALSTLAGYVDTEVAAILAAVDTEIGAIKTKTDQLVFTKANELDVNLQSLNGVTLLGDGSATPFYV